MCVCVCGVCGVCVCVCVCVACVCVCVCMHACAHACVYIGRGVSMLMTIFSILILCVLMSVVIDHEMYKPRAHLRKGHSESPLW